MKTISVLYVGTLPPHRGGSATFGAQLLVGLAELGHHVRALSPITSEALVVGDAFASAHPGLEVTRFTVASYETSADVPASDERQSLEGARIKEGMRALIECERPNVVIVGRETFAWHVPDVAAAHSIPTVLLIHGTTTFGILKGTIPPAMAGALVEQFRRVDRRVVVASHLAATLADAEFGPLDVIENTIDTAKFSPKRRPAALARELGIEARDVVVAHLSNLKPLKRPLDVVASAAQSLAEDPRLVYVVVGEGCLRRAMEEACRSEGVVDRFRFVGWVDYDRVPDYLNLADIVVMPSEAEARALVYLEAQACGRVLVASDIPSAREVVRDGETGLLFAKGDVAGLAAQTLRAAADASLREHIGRRAREAALVRPLASMVAAYGELLRSVAR